MRENMGKRRRGTEKESEGLDVNIETPEGLEI